MNQPQKAFTLRSERAKVIRHYWCMNSRGKLRAQHKLGMSKERAWFCVTGFSASHPPAGYQSPRAKPNVLPLFLRQQPLPSSTSSSTQPLSTPRIKLTPSQPLSTRASGKSHHEESLPHLNHSTHHEPERPSHSAHKISTLQRYLINNRRAVLWQPFGNLKSLPEAPSPQFCWSECTKESCLREHHFSTP